ncbi:hypothetical protein ABH940_000373 [Streptacidiphilus sp. BW17]
MVPTCRTRLTRGGEVGRELYSGERHAETIRPVRRHLSVFLLLLVLLLAGAAPPPALASEPRVVDEATLVDNGPAANRITLVLIGDGYTADELPRFRAQAADTWRALSSVEPFRSYAPLFDVRRIDLVSPRSGIGAGSPLGMHFGCQGMPRLLCADDDAVTRYTGTPDGPEYVIALADSDRYGGGGGTGVTTLAAGATGAGLIIQHEMGHTVGGLGDEYDAAPGGDSDFPNLSSADADTLAATHAKWWRWLGAEDPTGGLVGAYRSANGLYRPTQDSIMRTLGATYNLPSREAIIESLYRHVSPVDTVSPAADGSAVDAGTTLRVAPVLPADPEADGSRLTVSWTVDGGPAPGSLLGERGLAFDTRGLELPSGARVTVRVVVTDRTSWVRDDAFRRRRMSRTFSWVVTAK